MAKPNYKFMKNQRMPIRIQSGPDNQFYLGNYDEFMDNLYAGNVGELTFEEWICPSGYRLEDLKNYYFYQVIEKLGPSDIWNRKIKDEKSVYMQLVNYVISFLCDDVMMSQIMDDLLSVSTSNSLYRAKLREMGNVSTLILAQLEVTKRLIDKVSSDCNCIVSMFSGKVDFIYGNVQMLTLLYLKMSTNCISSLKNMRLYSTQMMLAEEANSLFKNKYTKQYFVYLMERKNIFVINALQEFGIKNLIDTLGKYSKESVSFFNDEYKILMNGIDSKPNYDYFIEESKHKKLTELFSNVRVLDEFGNLDTSPRNLKAWDKLALGSSQVLRCYGDPNYTYKSEGAIEDLFSKMLNKYKDTYLISNYSNVLKDMDLVKVLSYLILSRNDVETRLVTRTTEFSDTGYVTKLNTYNLYLAVHTLILEVAPDIVDTLPLMEWARKNDTDLYKHLLKSPCVNRDFSCAVEHNKKLAETESLIVVAFPFLQRDILNNPSFCDTLLGRSMGYNLMYSIDCSIKSYLNKEMLLEVEGYTSLRVNLNNRVIKETLSNCVALVDQMEPEELDSLELTDTVIGYISKKEKTKAAAEKLLRQATEVGEQKILKQIEEYGSIKELIANLKEGKPHPKSKIKDLDEFLQNPKFEGSGAKDEDGCKLSLDVALDLVQTVFYSMCMKNGGMLGEDLLEELCLFYYKFEEDKIDFPLALLLNFLRIIYGGDRDSKLYKAISKMDSWPEFEEYFKNIMDLYNNVYKVSKKKIKTTEDVKKFLRDEIVALQYRICMHSAALPSWQLASPELVNEMPNLEASEELPLWRVVSSELVNEMHNSEFSEDVELDLDCPCSFVMEFPRFLIRTTLCSDEFGCEITVNGKTKFIDLCSIKYEKNSGSLLNSPVCISNNSLLGILCDVNNDVLAWGKNGMNLKSGEGRNETLDKLRNPGVIGSKIYNVFPEETEEYVMEIQEWIGEPIAKNFIMSLLAEGVEKSQEYIERFIRNIINVHLNIMYNEQSGFLIEEKTNELGVARLNFAPEYYKWKKVSNKQFDSSRIDLEEFKYTPILKVTDSVVDILKFQVFLVKLGLYGSKYVKLPERFYEEEEQKHLEEVYNMLMKENNEDVIVDEDVKSFLFDGVKFEFPLLKDKLKLTNVEKIDPDNLKCYYLNRLGESLVLYDCKYDGEKVTIRDEAYLDYIENFDFYFNNGRLNEYNLYSPVVEDMKKINEETMKIAEVISEEQAITVYSYVVYAILILDRNRIIQLAENTRNRKFIGKVMHENEVDFEKMDSTGSKNKAEVNSDTKKNEEERQAVNIRRNSLNDEENEFLDTLSPEEFKLLENVSDINGVKVINLGTVFFKKMNKLMKGIRSLERVAPRYKVKNWAVRSHTRTSKNGVVSYIEGGIRRRNTELLDKDAIERQEKILSLDDVLKSTNIFDEE